MTTLTINPYNKNIFLTKRNKTATFEIGDPIFTLTNILGENEIWLEGAEVSRTTYSKLFEIYGTTYGAGDGKTTFKLPDFRGRTLWGKKTNEAYGYIEAGLPSHTHTISRSCYEGNTWSNEYGWGGDTGRVRGPYSVTSSGASNSIYGKSTTVQPPSVKVRVKTKYL